MEEELNENIRIELDSRIKNLEEGKTELYSWEEVKEFMKNIR